MANLLDLLSEEDRAKVKTWSDRHTKRRSDFDVPPELYTLAEFGYYYGWDAVKDAMRGYIEYKDQAGKVERSPLTEDLMLALIMAAQKVYYRKTVDMGDVMFRANISSQAGKTAGKIFQDNMRNYIEKSK